MGRLFSLGERRSERGLYPWDAMPKSARPRPSGRRERRPTPVRGALPRDVVEEIRRVARVGRGDEAIAHLERAAERLERGDSGEAVSEAAKAKQLASRSAAVREVLGLGLYHAGRFREALSELQAYRRMTGRADQNHVIADCERALGRPERAVALAEEAVRARISNDVRAEAVIVAASALADMKRYDQTLALLRRVRTRQDVAEPHVLRIWYVTTDLLARSGRREEAERTFRKIFRHDAAAFDVAERLAQLG